MGELAGRGYARQANTSGKLHFQVEEPGYVMGLVAITPMIDYSQGNDFDLNLFTMDDLHKPALDGIGYQDLMNEQRAWWTAEQDGKTIKDTTPGYRDWETDRKSTRLNSSHRSLSRMPSSA